MPQVQETQSGDHEGAGPGARREAQGLLESADGVARLFSFGELIATCYGAKKTRVDGVYEAGANHRIVWDCWRVDELCWSHKASLLFLQGSSMQQLVLPFLLLRAHPSPPYDPRPGAAGVVLAEVLTTPELNHQTLFSLLAPDALRLSGA